jgi:hypothetical protein
VWTRASSHLEHEHRRSAPALLQDIMIAMPQQRTCGHGKHWQNGCQLASGQMPPEQVQEAGRDSWMWGGVPFSWLSAWVGEPRDGFRRHGSDGAGLADLT